MEMKRIYGLAKEDTQHIFPRGQGLPVFCFLLYFYCLQYCHKYLLNKYMNNEIIRNIQWTFGYKCKSHPRKHPHRNIQNSVLPNIWASWAPKLTHKIIILLFFIMPVNYSSRYYTNTHTKIVL